MTTPNRIVLISHGRHEEGTADIALWPGMAAIKKANGNFIPHNQAGELGVLFIVKEDALLGGDITQSISVGSIASFQIPAKGDKMLMLLQNGQNVAAGVNLQSAGDGTLVVSPSAKLNEIVAPSTVVTNVAVDTAFSNGTYAIPANFLQVGDVIHVRSKVFCIAVNSTNTHRVRLYLGTAPITLADSTALILAANDVVIFDLYLTVRTITATGTFIADGYIESSVSGTFTTTPVTVASTTLDTTIAENLVVKVLPSVANAGNQVRLDEFTVELDRAGGDNTMVVSDEAINNSGGTGTSGFNTAAFIRVLVP